MDMRITIDGLDAARDAVAGYSDRRMRATVAIALTRTAAVIAGDWRSQLPARLDRPTPTTSKSVIMLRADASTMAAEVLIKNQVKDGGTPPAEYLGTQERGGARRQRKFEKALQAQGAMPSGYSAVPGKYAKLDIYGNVSRGQIVQIIAQLGAKYSPGYARVISKSAKRKAENSIKHGRNYISITNKHGKVHPGIYERKDGNVIPVMFFIRSAHYKKRIGLIEAGEKKAPTELATQINRAIEEQSSRLAGSR